MKQPLECDLLIIGGGIAGTAVARAMSRYKVKTILIQENESLCDGVSKTPTNPLYRGFGELNSILVKAYMLKADRGPLYDLDWPRARQEEIGWKTWHERWLAELDIPHKELKTLYLATNKEELSGLERVWTTGRSLAGMFADMEKVDRDFILEKEPNVNESVIAGLWSDTHHRTVAYPWDIVIALAENAQQNGVQMLRGARVTQISARGDSLFVQTARGIIRTRYIVNAAGANADRIARMVGAIDWECVIDKLLTFILDEQITSELASGDNYLALPARPQYMQSLVPTIGGNLLCNCTRVTLTTNRYDTAVSLDQLEPGLSIARQIIPAISAKDIINVFCGAAARHTKDVENHIVESHPLNPRFVTVKPRPPAFPAMPAIAEIEVPQLLADAGLELTAKPDFNPYRKAIPKLVHLLAEEKNLLIKKEPAYGHVVCRCKTVTKGEIIEAIRRGARTLQDIKFMTGAGLGRCQGGFCGPQVIRILAGELGLKPTKIYGREAPALLFESKGLLNANRSM